MRAGACRPRPPGSICFSVGAHSLDDDSPDSLNTQCPSIDHRLTRCPPSGKGWSASSGSCRTPTRPIRSPWRRRRPASFSATSSGKPLHPSCRVTLTPLLPFRDEHRQEQPIIVHTCGSACQELPVRHLGHLNPAVFATCTGPDGGLTTVNCAAAQKHVSTSDPDVDFIDDSRRSSSSSLKTHQLSSLSR